MTFDAKRLATIFSIVVGGIALAELAADTQAWFSDVRDSATDAPIAALALAASLITATWTWRSELLRAVGIESDAMLQTRLRSLLDRAGPYSVQTADSDDERNTSFLLHVAGAEHLSSVGFSLRKLKGRSTLLLGWQASSKEFELALSEMPEHRRLLSMGNLRLEAARFGLAINNLTYPIPANGVVFTLTVSPQELADLEGVRRVAQTAVIMVNAISTRLAVESLQWESEKASKAEPDTKPDSSVGE